MWTRIPICDLCKQDGKFTLAVAEYEGETKFLHCCKKHLKEIKSYGMQFYLLNKITLQNYLESK